MNKRIIILIFIILFILLYLICNNKENFIKIKKKYFNEWTKLDHLSRKNYDCNPIKKIGNIWIVSDNCEQGLPHTRYEYNDEPIIALTHKHYNNKKIIDHENIHIHQKKNYKKWKDFYEKEWYYTLSDQPPDNMPKELIEKYRINPDTFFEKWACFQKRYYSVPIYNKTLRLNNVQVIWWDSIENKILYFPPSVWIEFFNLSSDQQIEHPNEISAVYLSTNKNDSIAYKKLIDFYESNKY